MRPTIAGCGPPRLFFAQGGQGRGRQDGDLHSRSRLVIRLHLDDQVTRLALTQPTGVFVERFALA